MSLAGRGPHVLVFAGGDPNPPEALADLAEVAVVVGADSGAAHALLAGRTVDVVVGDLDSLEDHVLHQLEAAGAEVRRYPPAKDATDLALALDVAVELGAEAVTVVGGHGGRLDHLLANVALLADPAYASMVVDARLGRARIAVIRGRRALAGEPGELLTLLPVGGPARGVTTEGLLFPLDDATLRPGTTWGVSNQFTGQTAAVTVAEGTLLAIAPGEAGAL